MNSLVRIIKKSIAMNKLLVFLMLLCSFSAVAQQTKVYNDPNAKKRDISGNFTKISVSSGIELFLTQSNETSLAISVSDDKYEPRFKTEVIDGVLKLYYDNKGITWKNDKHAKLKAYLSCNSLQGINGSAGAKLVIANEFSFSDLALSFSSGALMNGKLQARSVTASVSSGAEIIATGVATKLTVTATSGAAFKGYDLMTEYCTASANSGASVKIDVQKELTASANSGGDIRYKGNATITKVNVNSGGSVKPGK